MIPTPIDEVERRARLRLARTDGVGAATWRQLIDTHGHAVAALEALPDLARAAGRSAPPRMPSPAQIEAECDAAAALGAHLVTLGEAAYPTLLAAIDGAPPALWILGRSELLERPAVAIVGSRSASMAGRRLAGDLARGLGEAGLAVVSGMARGIDAAAHAASLETGAVAVLAGAVDRPYPPQNLDLFRAIADQGCVVSERAMGHEARAPDFPRRNRIISGLSLGVVVVEAELRSGSLITARLAGEQGREVFAVPGSPLEPRARGTNDLIRQGAILVEEVGDVLNVLAGHSLLHVSQQRPPKRSVAQAPADPDEAADLAGRLESLLSVTPTAVDALAREAGAPVGAVLAALAELELDGRVRRLPGGLAARA